MKLFFRSITLAALTGAAMIISSSSAKAQGGLDELLESGISDAEKLIEGYVQPFMESFGKGMAGGWYNTAKPHKSLGFDLTFTVNAAYIPDDQLFYDIESLGLQNVELISPTDGKAPTIFGPEITPRYREISTQEEFDGPEGTNILDEMPGRFVPVPMAQLGIGIIKGTDLKIRFLPKIDIDDNAEVSMIGFGVMHDIKQYIPGIKNLPFDLSVFAGYTRFSLDTDLSEENPAPDDFRTEDPRGVFDVNSITFQGLISKKFSVLTLYGGIGYTSTSSKLALEGKYDFDDNGTFEADETNPISLEFNNSGPRVTAGARIKLAIFTLHADYTVQDNDVLTVGFGFNVR